MINVRLFPLILIGTANNADAFATKRPTSLLPSIVHDRLHFISSIIDGRRQFQHIIHMSIEDEDNYDEDEDEVDLSSLGDWRKFRMNLAETGAETSPSSSTESVSSQPKSVSKRNEALLTSQNSKLAREYLSGVWAHAVPVPEVGGLVCRMPLEVEIYRDEKSEIGKKLRDRVGLDESLDDEEESPDNSSNDMGAFYPVEEESDEKSAPSQPNLSFSALGAKTAFWYRGAEGVVRSEMDEITKLAGENNQIDASKLSRSTLEFLERYLESQRTWQEVCLVVENDEKGTTSTVAINRPMATSINEDISRLVLYGSAGFSNVKGSSDQLSSFLKAFRDECAIYVGGPDCQAEPALLIHGIRDLEGAEELSPGTEIFKGGLSAAINGILDGKYKPLEFRFFVGKNEYKQFALGRKVNLGKYQPIACARTLALKQCIGLPKPLYHEVLELCGGELKEISSLEIMKRNDLKED